MKHNFKNVGAGVFVIKCIFFERVSRFSLNFYFNSFMMQLNVPLNKTSKFIQNILYFNKLSYIL